MSLSREKLETFRSVLRYFSKEDVYMQVGTVLALVEVAIAELDRERIGVAEIEQRVGFTTGAVTRNLYYWGEGHRQVKGAYEFIDIRMSPQDRRRRDITLTPKGRAWLERPFGDRKAKQPDPLSTE